MSKELESFERIKNITYDRTDLYGIEVFRKDLDIIESALIDYEETDNQLYDLFEKFRINNRKDLLKKLKSLEIIKEKNINVRGIINSPTLEHYIDHCMPRHSEELTQEEFDLLKDVLL